MVKICASHNYEIIATIYYDLFTIFRFVRNSVRQIFVATVHFLQRLDFILKKILPFHATRVHIHISYTANLRFHEKLTFYKQRWHIAWKSSDFRLSLLLVSFNNKQEKLLSEGWLVLRTSKIRPTDDVEKILTMRIRLIPFYFLF